MEQQKVHFPILLEQDEDGIFIVSCPSFKGCHSYGKTVEEAIANIEEVITMCIADKSKVMGITNVILTVREHRKSKKFTEVAFLVDSGSIYSLVPGKILDDLEIEPYKTVDFPLADGKKISRKVETLIFNINSEGGSAPFI